MDPLIDYSEVGEALVLEQYLPNSIPRIVVDVEAGVGVICSLSRKFVADGWSAVLLEANTSDFHVLEQNCEGFPQVQCLNVRCSSLDGGNDGSANVRYRSLTALLTELQMPTDFGILVLNSSSSALETLKGLDPVRFRPRLIVTRDDQAIVERHNMKYDLISGYGYRYSGLAGQYSIWSSFVEEVRRSSSNNNVRIPKLPGRRTGRAMFDVVPGDAGTGGAIGHNDFMVCGWAFADLTSVPPPLVYIEMHDQRTGSTEYVQAYRCRRPDVSAHFQQRNLLMSGFRVLIPSVRRRPGSLVLRVLQADAENYYEADVDLVLESEQQEYEKTAREGFARKFLHGSGIEIGALQRALKLPKNCRVRYVDRMDLKGLLHHYPELKGLPLQPPDLIDDGEKLSRIADGSQDFVVANHFFEHCENPIQTLSNLLRVIRPEGVLFMAVPDKRYTFDFDRPMTDYSILKQTYETGNRPDREYLFREWVTYVQGKTGSEVSVGAAELMAQEYSIHYNVWSVDELVQFLMNARSDYRLPFRLASLACSENEAILILERT